MIYVSVLSEIVCINNNYKHASMVILYINTFSHDNLIPMTNSLQSQIQTTHKNYVWKCIKTVNACDTSLTDIPKPLG